MPGPEAEIERDIRIEAVNAGWIVRKLKFLDARGAPDRIFGKNGRCVLIEFKRPGERPTKQQARRHEELREAFGLEVDWADSRERARKILGLPEP